jgi:hypothetical protein
MPFCPLLKSHNHFFNYLRENCLDHALKKGGLKFKVDEKIDMNALSLGGGVISGMGWTEKYSTARQKSRIKASRVFSQ